MTPPRCEQPEACRAWESSVDEARAARIPRVRLCWPVAPKKHSQEIITALADPRVWLRFADFGQEIPGHTDAGC